MAHDVFISYSTRDKVVADQTCATLESRGIKCWIAPRNIRRGTEYGEAIIEAIKSSRVMLLIFSSNANKSDDVRREVARAGERSIPIIPFRLDDVRPSGSLEYFIGSLQWLDAFPPPVEAHFDSLITELKDLLSSKNPAADQAGASTETIIPPPPASDRSSSAQDFFKRFAVPLFILLGLVGLGAILLLYLNFDSGPVQSEMTGKSINDPPPPVAEKSPQSPTPTPAANQNTPVSQETPRQPEDQGGGSSVEKIMDYEASMPKSIYRPVEGKRQIQKVVITDTQSPNMLDTMNFLKDASRGVSYHYVIDKNGHIYRLVSENNIAIHTRELNDTSIAIAMIHMSNESYTSVQRESLINLLADIISRHNIGVSNIVTKQEVDRLRNKTDLTAEMASIREQVSRKIARS